MQEFYYGIDNLRKVLKENLVSKYLLVSDSSFPYLCIHDYFKKLNIPYIQFDDFQPNPLHDDVDKARAIYEKSDCNVIVAVGGGSSIDVAKCIKFDSEKPTTIIAIPTTAGTGSESTRHIVVYKDGKKESLGNVDNIPNIVIFEPRVLETLPLFQKKCTMLDALCQSIESYWNINATNESRAFAKQAIQLIIDYMDSYINDNDLEAAKMIMKAANLSGQAINITQTTAPHAMSYKITSMYKIPHGGAVAICLPQVWKAMLNLANAQQLTMFNDIAQIIGKENSTEAIQWFVDMLAKYDMPYPKANDRNNEINILVESINLVRLKNNPIQFDSNQIRQMYEEIVI